MKKKILTAKQVEHLETRDKRYEVPAGPPAGLYCVVHAKTGRKAWLLRYRYQGRTRGLTILADGLAHARAEAQSKLKELDEGRDPAAVQAEEQRKDEPRTCKAVAYEWLDRTMKGKATYDELKRILDVNVLPDWKHKPIAELDRPDILRLLDKTVDRGAPVLANRIHTMLKRWLKWCVMRGYIETSPAAVLTPPAEEESRDRVLTVDELAEIWTAAPALGYPFSDFLRLLVLTGQRRGEIANMKWPEIDTDAGLWTLPRASTKARRIHDVPLSPAVLAILDAMPRWKGGDYTLTSTSGERPISGFSKAKTALDAAILKRRQETDPKAKGLAEWHIHDIRRTMATWMADNAVAPHVLAAILNHSPGSTMGITAVYARSKWAKEKRAALQAWAEFVLSLDGKQKKAATA